MINLYGQYGRVFVTREMYDSAAYYLDEAFLLADKYQFPYTSYIYIRRVKWRRSGEITCPR